MLFSSIFQLYRGGQLYLGRHTSTRTKSPTIRYLLTNLITCICCSRFILKACFEELNWKTLRNVSDIFGKKKSKYILIVRFYMFLIRFNI
jgi:hypothetical protein